MFSLNTKDLNIAIIGLGYVGLPLALEFSKKKNVIGFDIDKKKISLLKKGIDKTFQVTNKNLLNAKKLFLTTKKKDLKKANCYIVTVPTPVNLLKKPDLKPLLLASKIVGQKLSKGDIVIYESTVFPGCTEDECVPILEKFSKLKYNKDFFCGYSPERINPGDKKHNISNIKKIVSGSTLKVANLINKLYKEIIIAGTFRASSIRVAEAAKVIENTQRDINIALINEFSIIFNKLNIDTEEVLKAANTKWNFLPFKPGLVGGHCIGVDPYYLTFKAKSLGYNPNIILAGRSINDNMAKFTVSQIIKKLKSKSINLNSAKILIMGLTFKENCNDLRNSGATLVFNELRKYKFKIDVYDPVADQKDIKKIYKIIPKKKLYPNSYDGIMILVAHDQFRNMGNNFISSLGKNASVLYDLKCIFKKEQSDLRL